MTDHNVLLLRSPLVALIRLLVLLLPISILLSCTTALQNDGALSSDNELKKAMHQTYEDNVKQMLADNPDIVTHYECTPTKTLAITPDPESDPRFDYYFPDFPVIVIKHKPDKRCSEGFFDAHSFVKWMWCDAKFKIAFDGYRNNRRSSSLPEMYSDDGYEFYGSRGLYFQAPNLRNAYLMEYGSEGFQFLETGTCKKM